ncbi:MAG: 4-hydroxy-tetrahydrodipicolinate synthase [Elusimicrobia bacterium]|nr:4-hydroxy-tetrahydrodipicolinate synthase [Elusimicrobiota bacterium]
MRLAGSITALITPFKGRALDEAALQGLIRFQLANGTSGLVPCGSTGEAATLHGDEYRRVIELTVRAAKGRAPVIAGVGSNDTEKAVHLAQEAAAVGADALLVLVPYYNKPTQEGLFRHFEVVSKATRLPVVAYNIPGRTGVNMAPATLARVARARRNVIAVKEASGSLDQVSETLRLCPPGFTVLSGDDSLTVPMMSVGASGVISVVSNVLPRETSRMVAAAARGDFRTAGALHRRLFPVMKALFVETNPIPVKAAAELMGLGSGKTRLPLTPAAAATRDALRAAWKAAGLRLGR